MTDRKYNFIDPELFDTAAIDTETAAFNEKIEQELSAQPSPYAIEPQVLRDARRAGYSVFGPIIRLNEVEDRIIQGPHGGIHAFNAFPIALAQNANNRISEFIRHVADE